MTDASEARPPLALIIAVARNGVIGKEGGLPWHIPEDLKHFKRTTVGHTVIMGRRTHESIGRALPSRRNIVVTRQRAAAFAGCEVAQSLEEAIASARLTDSCPFVIGGASLYEEALPLATEIYLTEIDRDVVGDTFFLHDLSAFQEVDAHQGTAPDVTFRRLRRTE